MGDGFQRLIVDAPPAVMSLNVQAAMGPVREPERSQFELLLRHFSRDFSIMRLLRRMAMAKRAWCSLHLRQDYRG